MKLDNQKLATEQLKLLAASGQHSILLAGPQGVGKTYLTRQYADMLHCINFISVEPKVSDIRDAIQASFDACDNVVICIENLDQGVAGAAYSLLKFLEEPSPYIYIVVTCRDLQHIPDTIISRCAVANVSMPTKTDLHSYLLDKYADQALRIENSPLYSCLTTFGDIDTVVEYTDNQLDYIMSTSKNLSKQDSISTLMWKLQKFEDGTPTPVELTLRYILHTAESSIRRIAYECLQDLASGRVAGHAVVAKFLFDYKYGA